VDEKLAAPEEPPQLLARREGVALHDLLEDRHARGDFLRPRELDGTSHILFDRLDGRPLRLRLGFHVLER
jgi:hypothetical protein